MRWRLALSADFSNPTWGPLCPTRYPFAEKLRSPLEATHRVIRVIVGLQDLGWPSRRRRSFCCGLVRTKLTWVGPQTDDLIQQDFNAMFHRRCVLNGKVFLLGSYGDIQQMYAKKLKNRGVHVDNPRLLRVEGSLSDILAPGQTQRLRAYAACKDNLDQPPEAKGDYNHDNASH